MLRTHAARLAARRRARATARAGCPTCGCSRSARSTSTRRAPGDAARAAGRCPDERTHLGALLTGAMRPPSWREPAPPRADFFAAKGVLAALLGALRADWAVEPATRAVPAPRPRRARAGRRRAGRLARRAAPGRRRGLGPRAGRGLRARPRRARAPRAARPALPRPHVVPVRAPGPRVVVPGHVAAGRRARRRARRGRHAAGRRGGLRRLRRRRGARRWRCGSSSAPPTARSPTRRSRSGARRSTPPWPSASGASRVASVAVLGAAGYAGAVAAALLHRHPELRARATSPRAPTPACGSTTCTRARACRSCSRSRPPTLDVDAAVVAYPHGAAAPVVAALRERGVRVVDLSRRLPAALARHLRGVVRRARRAGADRRRRLRAARSCTATRSAPRGSSPTPAATRPPRSSRSRRWPARACSATS